MLLLYGKEDPRIYDPYYCEKGYIFNLTTMREGYESLQILVPPNVLGHLEGLEFDTAYMNYIMQYDRVFLYFFRIMYHMYAGKIVYLLVDDGNWSENLIESLMKLIQQRYGVNGIMIQSEEDYMEAVLHGSCELATGYGLYNFDMDKMRFNRIVMELMSFKALPFYIEGIEET